MKIKAAIRWMICLCAACASGCGMEDVTGECGNGYKIGTYACQCVVSADYANPNKDLPNMPVSNAVSREDPNQIDTAYCTGTRFLDLKENEVVYCDSSFQCQRAECPKGYIRDTEKRGNLFCRKKLNCDESKGLRPNADQSDCECDIEGNFVWNNLEQACVCGDAYRPENGLCVPLNCDPVKQVASGHSCVCNTQGNWKLDDGICKCKSRHHQEKADGPCVYFVCRGTAEYDETSNACLCDADAHWLPDGKDSCKCDDVNHFVESVQKKCVCDADNGWVDDGNSGCTCNAAKHWVAQGDDACACDAANHWVLDSGSCVCDAAHHFVADDNNACVCDAKNGWADNGNSGCACNAAGHWVAQGNDACACDAANHWIPGGAGTCVCNAAKHFVADDNNACACDAKNGWMDDGNSGCTCNVAGHWVDDGTGVCACDANHHWKLEGGQCVCGGSIFDGNCWKDFIVDNHAAQIGNIVSFGNYPQDGDTPASLQWRVVEIDNEKHAVLLVSEYVIDVIAMDPNDRFTPWNASNIRNWLNNTSAIGFLGRAFSEEERPKIVEVTNSTADSNENTSYCTSWNCTICNGGEDSQDYVFLLDATEARKYFPNNGVRKANATKYAKDKGAYYTPQSDATKWWLRSPGCANNTAASVGYLGDVRTNEVDSTNVGIRPAMWVKY